MEPYNNFTPFIENLPLPYAALLYKLDQAKSKINLSQEDQETLKHFYGTIKELGKCSIGRSKTRIR